ncbi:MAG TPA: AI-2E family transporter [Solirubrobacteraceae bacterium]|nr:AI-2E family transporter [Solirubrobacteraceae bacterium]
MHQWDRMRAGARKAPEADANPEQVRDAGRTPAGDAARPAAGPRLAPGEAPSPPGAVPVAPVVVPRWVQMVMLPLALLGLWALARAAGTIVLVVVVAATVALILAPLVRRLERVMPRGLAIPVVYIGLVAVAAAIGFLLVSPVATQLTDFQKNVPDLIANANRELSNLQTWLDHHGLNIHIKQQGKTALQTLQADLLKRSSTIVSFSRSLLSTLVTVGFDFVLVVVLSIYMLVYGRQIGALVRRIMPPGDGTPEDDYPLLIQQAVYGYVRGQLLFSFVMGASAAIALTILGLVGIFPAGESYGVFFGAFYGLMEFIPYIGPIIGPIPAILVALFENPITAVWLILLFVALQQLEGHVVAPQMFRISLRINPILVIIVLLIGYQLYGIVGALVALPVSAVIRQTVVYLRRHLVLEPWRTAGPGVGVTDPAVSPGGPSPPSAEGRRCADCGASAGSDDAYCRACGTPLTPPVRSAR